MGWLEFRRSNRKTEASGEKGEFLEAVVSTEVPELYQAACPADLTSLSTP